MKKKGNRAEQIRSVCFQLALGVVEDWESGCWGLGSDLGDGGVAGTLGLCSRISHLPPE